MSAIAEIRIDIVADIAKILSQIPKANRALDKFADGAIRKMHELEKSFEKAGTKLTIKVTAPLVALGAAAIKAADPTGRMADEVLRLGLEARKALVPLGDVLLRLLTQAMPTLEEGVKIVNSMAKAFASLSPETQKTIVLIAAAAAAAGPLLLIMSSGLTLVKYITEALVPLASAILKVAAAAVTNLPAVLVILTAIGAVLSAIAGIEIGRYLYDEFESVQKGAAWLVKQLDNAWATIEAGFQKMAAAIEVIWDKTTQKLTKVMGPGLIAAGLGGFMLTQKQRDELGLSVSDLNGLIAAGSGLKQAGASQTLDQRMDKISADLAEKRKFNDQVYQATLRDVTADFAQRGDHGRSFVDFMKSDLDSVMTYLGGAWDKFKGTFAGGELPFVITPREQKQLDEYAASLAKLTDEAQGIRFEFYPKEELDRELARLETLRDMFPTIIDDKVFAQKVDKIEEQFLRLDNKVFDWLYSIRDGIKAASGDMAKALADFAVDGKNSLGDLFKSWERMLIEMSSQKLIFGPLTSAAGDVFSQWMKSFAAKDLSGIQTGPTRESARGNVFLRGNLVAMAAGAIVGGPTLFPMAHGGTGLMGEAGPEAVMPLQRIGGKLGVNAVGGGTVVQIIDQRSGGARPQVSESTGPDGRKMVQVLIRDEVRKMIGDGGLDRAMSSSFGLGRKPIGR